MTSRYEGPFVMNTEEELDQAVIDHPSGRRTEIESPARAFGARTDGRGLDRRLDRLSDTRALHARLIRLNVRSG